MEILITKETHNRVMALSREVRKERILLGMDMSTPGIEISPLYNPVTDKSKHNVFYTDYTSADESRKKHANYEHPEIVDLDFVWDQQFPLSSCVPDNKKFEWAVACHVLEHVPDPIGWLNEILDCLNVEGVVSIVLPNSDLMSDKLRKKTEVSDMLESWLNRRKMPGPAQIYDFLRNNMSQGDTSIVSSDGRHYTKQQALDFTLHSWNNTEYLDVHCSVFTPWGFEEIINEITTLGIMNVEVVEICPGELEFYAKLKKKGEPRISRDDTRSPLKSLISEPTITESLHADLHHARNAFAQAVAIQDELKREIERLKRPFWKRIFNIK